MKQYLLYGHGGAYNHGSEAVVRCTIALLRRVDPGCRITLSSHFPEQDRQFAIDADEIIGRDPTGKTDAEIYAETIRRITPETVCLSMGGDNYCYPNWQRYAAIHYAALERGAKSILWCCSIEPSILDKEMLAALRTHDKIVARESLSFTALRERGIENTTWAEDIAFMLPPVEARIPVGPYVAVNLSPLVVRKNPGLLNAYQQLIHEIIDLTDWKVALVPHVEMPVDNDCEILAQLSGTEDRIYRVQSGLTAAQYKYIVSNAKLCVTARTHVAIAAWSDCVPTLAVGYSTKTRGIALDIGQEEFVVDAERVDNQTLCETFWRLYANRSALCEALRQGQTRRVNSGTTVATLYAALTQ